MPNLSRKHTTIYLVVATHADARFEANAHGSLDAAKVTAAEWRARMPRCHVQTHEIRQSLPEGDNNA